MHFNFHRDIAGDETALELIKDRAPKYLAAAQSIAADLYHLQVEGA